MVRLRDLEPRRDNREALPARRRFNVPDMIETLDIYPKALPTFNLNGRQNVPSFIGAFLSMISIIILLMYGTNNALILVNRGNPNINSFVK